jgi:ATP-dependent helicase/nuclease subunit A
MEGFEEEEERIRLLYVATTRAADYLMLASGVSELDKADGPWMKLLASRFDLATGKLIASLPSDYATPEVKVTAAAPDLPAESETTDSRRPSLGKIVEVTTRLAKSGEGRQPARSAPVEPDLDARRQFSFSALHGTLESPQSYSEAMGLERLPLQTVQVNALELGTLVHAVLADLALDGGGDIAALVARHAARQLADPATEAEARALVRRFLESTRWQHLKRARQKHIELEFLLAWPPESSAADCRYLQGFVDCLYQDDVGDWHLLDYKTNRVDGSQVDTAAASYEMQMLVYALAVEQILGQPPETLTLHFLRPSAEKQFDWNEPARRRVVTLVNQSIAAFVAQEGKQQPVS